jgi:hypothetical protein
VGRCREPAADSCTSSGETRILHATTSASHRILTNAFAGTTKARVVSQWRIALGRFVVSIEFPTEKEVLRFERYLKSGSGRAFAKRHFAAAP